MIYLAALVALAALDFALSAALPPAWAAPMSRVLWPVGLLWLGALYFDPKPQKKVYPGSRSGLPRLSHPPPNS